MRSSTRTPTRPRPKTTRARPRSDDWAPIESQSRARPVWTLPDEPHFLIPTQSDSMAGPQIVICRGLVYVTTSGPDKQNDRRFVIARLEDGKVLVDESRDGDFWFQIINDRLLHCRDWAHGRRASWSLYSVAPPLIPQTLRPVGNLSTADNQLPGLHGAAGRCRANLSSDGNRNDCLLRPETELRRAAALR